MAEATFHKSTLREYFESIVVAVILALFIRTFVVQAFKIPTGSMEPNLLVGDHLLVNKFIFAPAASRLERLVLPMREIRRGDVIVFKFPEEPERDFIKRVIGLPGDTIELRQRQLYVNGIKQDEAYAHYLFPQGEGDESTAHCVKGRALMIYWSFEPPPGEQQAGLPGLVSSLGSIVTSTRWTRLLHQIH